jgi:hypothetical protein
MSVRLTVEQRVVNPATAGHEQTTTGASNDRHAAVAGQCQWSVPPLRHASPSLADASGSFMSSIGGGGASSTCRRGVSILVRRACLWL